MSEEGPKIIIEKGKGMYLSTMIWPGRYDESKPKTIKDYLGAFYYIIKWTFFCKNGGL